MSLWHLFLHGIGVLPRTPSTAYNFWSGFGSDVGEVVIIGGLVQLYRKHSCHVRGCWRISRHPVEGTPYVVCTRHHPTVPTGGATVEEIHAAHSEAQGS